MNFADRIKDTSITSGNGPITLANVSPLGFRTFASGYATGTARIPYLIDDGLGNWEAGLGTLSATTTLTRDKVLASSNGGALVNFGVGAKFVYATAPAALLGMQIPASATIPLAGNYTMATQIIGAALTLTVDTSNASPFNRFHGAFIADGAHVPTITGAVAHSSDVGFTNTSGVENLLTVFYAPSGRAMYAWSQDAAHSPVGGGPTLAPTILTTPAIIGSPTVGSPVSYTPGTYGGGGATISRQWTLDNAAINGATAATYTPASGDATHLLRIVESATNVAGSSGPNTSAPVTISAAVAAPANTLLPSITGTAAVGQSLTCSSGAWSGSPTSFAYQWKRDNLAISGATATTYTLVSADAGTSVSCTVSASNGSGTTSASAVGVSVPGSADTKPRYGVGPANAYLNFASTFASSADIPGTSNAGKSGGPFTVTPGAGQYGWVAVLQSAASGGVTFTDSLGSGGWSGAGLNGNNTGASPSLSTSSTSYTDATGIYLLFRQDYANSAFTGSIS